MGLGEEAKKTSKDPKGSHLIDQVGESKESSEFYTPYPKGYVKGKTKYVVVLGTVMSGLGKGIFASSLARLLINRGLTVAPIKFDGYLNCDAGTLNPYRHGEVFVLKDGLECDMDLGTYERYMNLNLDRDNYLTGGKLFKKILDKEREGGFLGRDVQFIPHVTGEIKLFMRELAIKRNADIVFMEVGGTVGDIENSYMIEAMRELSNEEGDSNVCFVALTYVLDSKVLGEQKSKAAQLGIRKLMEFGIQPHIIPCRAERPVAKKVLEKISIYSNLDKSRIISLHDCKNIYEIPGLLRDSKVDELVISILDLENRATSDMGKSWTAWKDFARKIETRDNTINIAIVGKYTGLKDSYASILNALEVAGTYNSCIVNVSFVESSKIESGELKLGDAFRDIQGIIIPGGFGNRGIEGKILCSKYARENNIPFLGICLGFQMALVDIARNVCNLDDAHSTEIKVSCTHPVVDILESQKEISGLGGTMRLGEKNVEIKKNSLIYDYFGKTEFTPLRFRHRFECNPEYIKKFEESGVVFSGKAPGENIMQIFEYPKNDFFVGTQAHPEFTSKPLEPSPFFLELVKNALKQKR